MRSIRIIILLLASATTNAAIVTLDFEGVVADNSSIIPASPYVENGMAIVAARQENGIFGKDAYGNSNGTAVYGWCSLEAFYCNDTQFITLSNYNDSTFDLLSIDASDLEGGGPTNTMGNLEVTGFLSGGGTVYASLALIEGSWQTFTFDSQWTNLVSVDFYGDPNADFDVGIDNVTVNAIPIPAAVWLFGSALAGLGWFRRRQ